MVFTGAMRYRACEAFDCAEVAGKCQFQGAPKDQVLDGAQTDRTALSGLVATTRIFQGEQVTANRFGGTVENTSLAIPDGMMAISVNLPDPARVAGCVNPGSAVAILVTSDKPHSTAPQRLIVARFQHIARASCRARGSIVLLIWVSAGIFK